jgi:succinate dehydrogenase/fumarate reductase flavoprotein subunit
MWDNVLTETEVLVIGYGGAGANTAISAHDNGAKVTIIEKLPAGGGNTALSGGVFCVPRGDEAKKLFEALCSTKISKDILDVYVQGCSKIPDSLKELGAQSEIFSPLQALYPMHISPCWPKFPGMDEVETHWIPTVSADKAGAAVYWELLVDNIKRRKIEVMTNTSATELITNTNGEVIGVIANKDGKIVSIKAKKAVVLTCGGFEYDDILKDTYLPLTPLYPIGSPGNTGDGLLMYHFYGWPVFKTPEYSAAFTIRFHSPNVIFVDKNGRRFTNEMGWEDHELARMFTYFMAESPCYPSLPVYAIFSDTTRRKGPLASGIVANDQYNWSLDNSAEIAKGWIKQGKTIGELARRAAIDESTLDETVAKYNTDCKIGKDSQFNRSIETLEPIDTAPYYAIELWPGVATTQGGPRRDKNSRVLNHEGKPIPRLYAAGALGSIWGFLTLGGGGLSESLVFGQIAGRNAALEKPWV